MLANRGGPGLLELPGRPQTGEPLESSEEVGVRVPSGAQEGGAGQGHRQDRDHYGLVEEIPEQQEDPGDRLTEAGLTGVDHPLVHGLLLRRGSGKSY